MKKIFLPTPKNSISTGLTHALFPGYTKLVFSFISTLFLSVNFFV